MKKVMLFIVIIISINSILCWAYFQFSAPYTYNNKKELQFKKQKANIETLILGHSRATSIDDNIMDGVFNFASFGENNVLSYYKLKKVLDNPSIPIKRVVLPVGCGSFFSPNNYAYKDHAYWNKYIDYNELGTLENKKIDFFKLYIVSKLFPYRNSLLKTVGKLGYKKPKRKLKHLKSEKEKYQLAKQNLGDNFNDRRYNDDVSFLYFKKILELCENKDVDVILIKYPVTTYYREVFSTEKNTLNGVKFEKLILKQNLTIWNKESMYDEQESLFKDTHHLNKKGAKQFTLIFKNKLEQHIINKDKNPND
jgi:hypothetical protein